MRPPERIAGEGGPSDDCSIISRFILPPVAPPLLAGPAKGRTEVCQCNINDSPHRSLRNEKHCPSWHRGNYPRVMVGNPWSHGSTWGILAWGSAGRWRAYAQMRVCRRAGVAVLAADSEGPLPASKRRARTTLGAARSHTATAAVSDTSQRVARAAHDVRFRSSPCLYHVGLLDHGYAAAGVAIPPRWRCSRHHARSPECGGRRLRLRPEGAIPSGESGTTSRNADTGDAGDDGEVGRLMGQLAAVGNASGSDNGEFRRPIALPGAITGNRLSQAPQRGGSAAGRATLPRSRARAITAWKGRIRANACRNDPRATSVYRADGTGRLCHDAECIVLSPAAARARPVDRVAARRAALDHTSLLGRAKRAWRDSQATARSAPDGIVLEAVAASGFVSPDPPADALAVSVGVVAPAQVVDWVPLSSWPVAAWKAGSVP